MTGRWRPTAIAAATAGMLAAGGSIAAFADWRTPRAATTVTVTATTVPTMAAPRVLLVGRPLVRWDRVSLVRGVPVERYVVRRHAGTASGVACDVPAFLATCVDLLAPVNKRATYSVHATFGRWVGDEGARSRSLRVPAGLAAPTAAVVAKLTAAQTAGPEALRSGADAAGGEPVTPQSGTDATGRPSTEPPGTEPESEEPGTPQPGAEQPGTAGPEATEPETGRPGTPPSSSGTPSTTQPGTADPEPNEPARS